MATETYLFLHIHLSIRPAQPPYRSFSHFQQPVDLFVIVLDEFGQRPDPGRCFRIERCEKGRQDGQDVFFVF